MIRMFIKIAAAMSLACVLSVMACIFSHQTWEGFALLTARGPQDAHEITLVDTNHRVAETISSRPSALPAWSSKDKSLFFIAFLDGWANIFQFDADTGQINQLTFEKSLANILSLSPDGSMVAYVVEHQDSAGNRNSRIRILDLEYHQVNNAGERVAGRIQDLEWSPDGTTLAFIAPNNQQVLKIHLLDLKTGQIKPLIHNDYPETYLEWSPDGKAILYTAKASQYTSSPHQFILESGEIINLTNPVRYELFPAFSPDGSKIAFLEYTGQQNHGLYWMNSDGTDLEALVIGEITNFQWSETGEEILFTNSYDVTSLNVSAKTSDHPVPLMIDFVFDIQIRPH
jgi:Tol biopolymer transport system component